MNVNTTDFTLKVLVVGHNGAGKTSLVQQFSKGINSADYKPTIGVDFGLKVLVINGKSVKVQLWDIAGQEYAGSMTRVYYKEAEGALLVYDITNKTGLESAQKWQMDIDAKVRQPNSDPIPVLLLANKCDLEHDPKAPSKEILDAHGLPECILTSAKMNIGIDQAIAKITNQILINLDNRAPQPALAAETVPLTASPRPKATSSCNC